METTLPPKVERILDEDYWRDESALPALTLKSSSRWPSPPIASMKTKSASVLSKLFPPLREGQPRPEPVAQAASYGLAPPRQSFPVASRHYQGFGRKKRLYLYR